MIESCPTAALLAGGLPIDCCVIELVLLKRLTWPVAAALTAPTWITVLPLLSDGVVVPCMVLAAFKTPTCTVVDVFTVPLPNYGRAVREAKLQHGRGVGSLSRGGQSEYGDGSEKQFAHGISLLFKLSNRVTDAVLEKVDIVG